MQSIEQQIEDMMDEICEQSADIIAEEATEYFKERFTEKEWDGTAWPLAKSPKRSGSLLVKSSALLNSIRPIEITKERVVIAAGNEYVGYAQVHNEGYDGDVTVKPFTRQVRDKEGKPVVQNVKGHTRHMLMPKRQFMGETDELDEKIISRIENYINSIL